MIVQRTLPVKLPHGQLYINQSIKFKPDPKTNSYPNLNTNLTQNCKTNWNPIFWVKEHLLDHKFSILAYNVTKLLV